MSFQNLDIVAGANITASSFDDSSAVCRGGVCRPIQVSTNSDLSDDGSFWQSEFDPSCAAQWIQLDWRQNYTIQNISIEYGSLGFIFSGRRSQLQVVLNPDTSSPMEVSDSVSCTSRNVTNLGHNTRLDTCSIVQPQNNVTGIRIKWNLDPFFNPNSSRRGCQMNVDEIQINSLPFNDTGLATVKDAGRPFAGIDTGLIGLIVIAIVLGTISLCYLLYRAYSRTAPDMTEALVSPRRGSSDSSLSSGSLASV
ncbi:hypothetical protein BC830DRAFT_1157267 [Chytriomyces sp. MP71]|nr:hypothetical protein BC830DRAFT_1157267 [Chytriomyces sp. MP71]